MTTITLNDAVYYREGEEYIYELVGNAYDSPANVYMPTVARYTFAVPENQDTFISLSFKGWYQTSGDQIPLYFYIGTDPESHINADSSFEYTGKMIVRRDGLTFGGSANLTLLPNTTYYLWLFPEKDMYGVYDWEVTKGELITSAATYDFDGNLDGATYYRSGDEYAYQQVGNAWSGYSPVPTIARYMFTTNASGASSVSLSFKGYYKSVGDDLPIYFYIGTDPESHINADSSFEYTGELVAQGNQTFSGSADILLLPYTVYYLWLFPANNTYGLYSWENTEKEGNATLTLSGCSGVIYIDNGAEFAPYQIYIDNGIGWDLYISYIDNGISWDVIA